MKHLITFALGAAIMYYWLTTDQPKPRRVSGCRITVDTIPDPGASIAVAEAPHESNLYWLANRTRQWITDLDAVLNKPYEPKGVFANVRKAH